MPSSDAPFASSSLTSYSYQPKISISLEELCSDIFRHLVQYDTILTIEQLLQVDEELCAQHGVPNFSAFSYDAKGLDNNPENFLSFLNKYRDIIDPHDELSIYEQTEIIDDRTEIYSFVQQLSVVNNDEIDEDNQQQRVALIHGHISNEQIHINPEELATVEKAVKHKFGRSIGYRKGKQIMRKAKKRFHSGKQSLIR